MNIVLVCINNYQEYILNNIKQLITLGHYNIFVIIDSQMFPHFNEYNSKIKLIDINELNDDTHNFSVNSCLDRSFRNGFWHLTSLRFFYIYEFMKKYNVDNVIHLENDVPIYYNCNELNDYIDQNFMYIPFDSYKRNIASIMYIPNKEIFKIILDNYDFNKNDMDNFTNIKQKTKLIKNFPIFIKNKNLSDEQNFVSENSDTFPFIFDAAAIGQYLGGVDPRNDPSDTKGFINETCVIKYNKYKIWFEEINKIKKPFIQIEDKKIPIFNLHIHSKNLIDFI
jgi:hypothetical protein